MSECTHRWRIAEPDGRSRVEGVCRHCGAERMFTVADCEVGSWREPYQHIRVFGHGEELKIARVFS